MAIGYGIAMATHPAGPTAALAQLERQPDALEKEIEWNLPLYKAAFIPIMAERLNWTMYEAVDAYNTMVDLIIEYTCHGQGVPITKIGTFTTYMLEEHIHTIPATGKNITIPGARAHPCRHCLHARVRPWPRSRGSRVAAPPCAFTPTARKMVEFRPSAVFALECMD